MTTTSQGGQRLAQSRLAILDYLQRTRHGALPLQPDAPQAYEPSQASPWRGLREAGRRHWEGHPARLVAGLAAPWLGQWGRRHPLAFLTLAAAAGAALVMARPWKLVSVTGLLVAALKSSHLASLLMSLMAASRSHPPGRGPR